MNVSVFSVVASSSLVEITYVSEVLAAVIIRAQQPRRQPRTLNCQLAPVVCGAQPALNLSRPW